VAEDAEVGVEGKGFDDGEPPSEATPSVRTAPVRIASHQCIAGARPRHARMSIQVPTKT
jgi:hypothetical protein